jgi:hypothetical protein
MYEEAHSQTPKKALERAPSSLSRDTGLSNKGKERDRKWIGTGGKKDTRSTKSELNKEEGLRTIFQRE